MKKNKNITVQISRLILADTQIKCAVCNKVTNMDDSEKPFCALVQPYIEDILLKGVTTNKVNIICYDCGRILGETILNLRSTKK